MPVRQVIGLGLQGGSVDISKFRYTKPIGNPRYE